MKTTTFFITFALLMGISMTARVSVYDMHKYLSEPLKGIFNSTDVDIKTLEKFVAKHDLVDMMSKFVKSKKKALKAMPSNFFFGLMYPGVAVLDNYEKEASEALINNEKYKKDPKLFIQTYPRKACYSANLTISLFDLQNMIDWNNWDPMRFYNGIVNAVRNLNPSSATQLQNLQGGVKNVTESLTSLKKLFDNPHYTADNGCLMYIEKMIDEYIEIFKSSHSFKAKVDEYQKVMNKSAVKGIENVIDEMGRNYFQALSPHPISFKMAATNLGEILIRMK